MPLPTPFHERTAKLCESLKFKDWAGYFAVCSYDTTPEREYFTLRHAVGVIDVTPLFKYDITGKDAGGFLDFVTVKSVSKLKVGQVTYLCWCDEDGKVLDDGTVTRLSESHFRMTAAEPTFSWLSRLSRGFSVAIADTTDTVSVLSVQGCNSKALLKKITDADLDRLGFFKATSARFQNGFEGVITRTGYTGDLGYEIWVQNADALKLWDALFHEGRPYGLEACGLDAMDMTRIEAGFIMNGVDYFSSNRAFVDSRKSTPYEIGLGRSVVLDRARFMGQAALKKEKEQGPEKSIVCLEIDWNDLENHFNKKNLPPEVPAAAWRGFVPVYDSSGKQIGKATSGVFSPTLKKNLAIATVQSRFLECGTELGYEINCDYEKKVVKATVVPSPQFNPERKRS